MKLKIEVEVAYDSSKLNAIGQDVSRQVQQSTRQATGGGRGAVAVPGLPAPAEVRRAGDATAREISIAGRRAEIEVRNAQRAVARAMAQDAKQYGQGGMRSVLGSVGAAAPFQLGMPLAGARALSQVMHSGALASLAPFIGGAAAVGGAGYLAYREAAQLNEVRRTAGAMSNLSGVRRTIPSAMEQPSYAATGSFYDMLWLPGFLTPWRKEQSITKSGNALAGLAPLRADDFTGGGQFKKFQSMFNKTAQLMGVANEPEKLAALIEPQLQGLTGEGRQNVLGSVLTAQMRSQEAEVYRRNKVSKQEQKRADDLAFDSQQEANRQIARWRRGQEIDVVIGQKEAVRLGGIEQQKVMATQVGSRTAVNLAQQKLVAESAAGMGGDSSVTQFATSPQKRQAFLIAKAAREAAVEVEKINSEERDLGAAWRAATETTLATNENWNTAFNLWKKRTNPIGSNDQQVKDFNETLPSFQSARLKAEVEESKAMAELKAFSSTKASRIMGVTGLLPIRNAGIIAESQQYSNRVAASLSGSGSEMMLQELGIRSGMRGVSRVSAAAAGLTGVGMLRSENTRQIALARSRGDDVEAQRLGMQGGVLGAMGQSAKRGLFFEAGRPQTELQSEREQIRLERLQEARGERRLRVQYDEEMYNRRRGRSQGGMETFEKWMETAPNAGKGRAGQSQGEFFTAVQSANQLAKALDDLTSSVKGRGGGGSRNPLPQ